MKTLSESTLEQQPSTMKFKDAPLGVRFKHTGEQKSYVKLSGTDKGLICDWYGNIERVQMQYFFVDKNKGIDFDTEIEIIS